VDFKKMPKAKTGHDNAFVIIDRLGKIVWTTPCFETATATDAARMYYEGPFRILGLPDTVVSDRGPQFVSDFQDEMNKILGIKWKLSTPGHSQTAGQAEIMNAYFDQRLRPYVSHFQDDWPQLVPSMDFVQCSTPHDSLGGLQPHEVLTGFEMPAHYDWSRRTQEFASARERLSREEAQAFAQRIHDSVEHARRCVKGAQERMIQQANKHRKEPDFGVGDRVFIVKKGWSTNRPSDKLDFALTRRHYKITKAYGNAYELELPDNWRAARQFNAERLRKYPDNPLPGQEAENPAGELVDGEEEWEVEKVTASRLYYHKLQYQVQWKGWDPDPEWYYASDFKNAAAKLKEYHEANPQQAGPPLRLQAWLDAALNDKFDPPHPDDELPASTRRGTQTRASRKT
jgi:transposase InsO family protein